MEPAKEKKEKKHKEKGEHKHKEKKEKGTRTGDRSPRKDSAGGGRSPRSTDKSAPISSTAKPADSTSADSLRQRTDVCECLFQNFVCCFSNFDHFVS